MTSGNRLIIPEMEDDLESIRNDLRKLILLSADEAQVLEATASAVEVLLDRMCKLETVVLMHHEKLGLPMPERSRR